MHSYTFHISGTHCNACKILIEDILAEDVILTHPNVDLKNETLSFEIEEGMQDVVLEKLNLELLPFGYTLSSRS